MDGNDFIDAVKSRMAPAHIIKMKGWGGNAGVELRFDNGRVIKAQRKRIAALASKAELDKYVDEVVKLV